MNKFLNLIVNNSSIIIFFIVWEMAARMIDTLLFPSFLQVMDEFYHLLRTGILIEHLVSTFLRVIAGYAAGGILGIIIGILMSINKRIELSLKPLISILFPIPTLGWLPLLMLWIGINEMLPIVLIFICAFFPVVYATLLGMKEVPKEFINTAKSLGASELYILLRIKIPLASPSIFTGLRLESGMVWKTVLAAEMFAIPKGIGALMINAESLIRVDVLMVGLITLAIMSFCFEKSIYLLERGLTRKWRS